MKFFALAFIIFCFSASNSHARCFAAPTLNTDRKILEEAAFIGLIEIKSSRDLEEGDVIEALPSYSYANIRENKVMILDEYKGSVGKEITVYSLYNVGHTPRFGEAGEIYEREIYKDGDYYIYLGHCIRPLSEKAWTHLRSKFEFSRGHRQLISKCKLKNMVFTNQRYRSFFDCFAKAEDAEKICTDNSECEGVCIAKVTDSEIEEHEKLYKSNPELYENPVFGANINGIKTKSGICSKFSNPKNIYLMTIEDGKTKRFVTEKEDK